MTDNWLLIFTYDDVKHYNIIDQVTHDNQRISEEEYNKICTEYTITFLENEILNKYELNVYQILNK